MAEFLTLYTEIEGVPPTTNKAYFDMVVKKGKKYVPVRTLTAEGKAYKTLVRTHIAKAWGSHKIPGNRPLSLVVKLSFPNIENKGWPDKAEQRYKKLDVSNRIKLLEDALSDAIAVDDRQFFSVFFYKLKGEEKTHIWLTDRVGPEILASLGDG